MPAIVEYSRFTFRFRPIRLLDWPVHSAAVWSGTRRLKATFKAFQSIPSPFQIGPGGAFIKWGVLPRDIVSLSLPFEVGLH